MITSVAITFRPNWLDSGAAAVIIEPILSGTSMDTAFAYPVIPAAFRNALDIKRYDPRLGFKRFYRIGSYAKSKMVGWRSTDQAVAGAFAAEPNCQTVFNVQAGGFAPGTSLGIFEVTYYVKFRFRTGS